MPEFEHVLLENELRYAGNARHVTFRAYAIRAMASIAVVRNFRDICVCDLCK
jgi:hypothetical protein